MEKNERRKKRAWADHIIALYLLVILFILTGQILGSLLMAVPFMMNTEVGLTAVLYLMFIGIWVVTALYMRFTKKNRPILRTLGTATKGNNWRNLLTGFAIGFGLNGICVLAAGLHGDISLRYDVFQPIQLIFIFLAVFVQSSAEELVCRGFLYQRLMRSYGKPAVAIIGNSLLFALLHLMNDGITALSVVNIFMAGMLFSLCVYYMDSLWCAMAVHTAWNFTQNIIFGLPNSGNVVPYSVFKLDAGARDSFAYNVGFGIEGTVFADAVLILACVGLWAWGRNHGAQPTDIWAGTGSREASEQESQKTEVLRS